MGLRTATRGGSPSRTATASRPGTGQPGTAARNGQPISESLSMLASRLGTPMYISDHALLPEEETIQLIGSLLRVPTLLNSCGDSEDQVAAACCGADDLATDPDFPPCVTSLYPHPDCPPDSAADVAIVWRRVSGAVYLPSKMAPQLVQGAMNSGSFLGALAAVACRPDLLLDLIVSDNQEEEGLYTLQFFKHGCWHPVIIDNYMPCLENEEKLAFTSSSNPGEMWPSLIEKAYAKGGSVADCLTDLTGGVTTKVRLSPDAWEDVSVQESLWQQLKSLLYEGAIIACKAKPSPEQMLQIAQLQQQQAAVGDIVDADGQPLFAEESASGASLEGYGGIMLDLVYSIVDAQEVGGNGRGGGGGERLIRIHCPWECPAGVWQGEVPFAAAGGLQGTNTASSGQQADDPACAWLSLQDFLHAFNRIYVCRRFPSTWHQLTLHCGWQGPSAGGPPARPQATAVNQDQVLPSSTFCCNPQFRLVVRDGGEVVVALGQVDPRIEGREHVRKVARKRNAGIMVFAVRQHHDGLPGRVWSDCEHEVVADIQPSSNRELVVSFTAQQNMSYVLVPYAGKAGDEGAFILRAYASNPLELEQLPSPLSLVLGGAWTGPLAGGGMTQPTWGSNPQYMLAAPCKTQVVISCSRLDVRYAVLKPAPLPEQAVGLALVNPDRTTSEGLAPHKTCVQHPSEVLASCDYEDCQEAVLITEMEPGKPVVLVPSLTSPSLEAPFELRIMSGVPLELVPLPELCTWVGQGSWSDETSGGCDLCPSWKKNPRFLLQLSRPCAVKLILSRPPVQVGSLLHRQHSSVDDMIGMYVFRASEPSGAIKGELRRSVIAETTFTTALEATGEYQLQEDVPYVIMPCKYGAGRTGKFSVAVKAPVSFTVIPL